MSVHPIAAKGFGSDSADYDAARPDHQPPAVNKLLENLAIPAGGKVVEVGSGTGKFSTHLLNRPEKWEIICVEPSADMRAVHKKLQPDVDIRDGTAYALPVETGTVDAIIVAQAFHWFGNADALKEFARALKPGGSLGLIWNHYDYSKLPDYQEKIFTEAWRHEEGVPQYRTFEWQKAFDSDVAKENYVLPLNYWEYKWVRKVADNGVWPFLRSLSYINKLSPEEKEVMRQHVEQVMKEADQEGKLKRDENGLIVVPSRTDVRWIKRR